MIEKRDLPKGNDMYKIFLGEIIWKITVFKAGTSGTIIKAYNFHKYVMEAYTIMNRDSQVTKFGFGSR